MTEGPKPGPNMLPFSAASSTFEWPSLEQEAQSGTGLDWHARGRLDRFAPCSAASPAGCAFGPVAFGLLF